MRKTLLIAGMICSICACYADDAPKSTPAQQRIEFARKSIQAAPAKFQGYNQLAQALIRRQRETSDPGCFDEAERAVTKSLELEPGNFDAQKAGIELMLGRREFEKALETARALNHRVPDDVPVWGYLAEANLGLGDYPEAEKAAQWMLDLRRNNVAGLLEGAKLRRLYGDADGALDFLRQAYQQNPPNEFEQSAWLRTRMAEIELERGKTQAADQLLDAALRDFPGYYLALEVSAQAKIAERRYPEAAALLRERNRKFPTIRSRYALAQALEQAGDAAAASAAYADFEAAALPAVEQPANANRELVSYYAGPAHQPARALRIARIEIARHHDVLTLDAYAWALAANRQYAEARIPMSKALAVGIRNGELFYHAGEIARKLGNRTEAARYFKEAAELGWPMPENLERARL